MIKRMDCFPKALSAVSAFKRMNKGEIDLAPEYQRGKVWSRKRQALLIDSMLRGYDLPKFYLREVPDGPDEVVDGQQRLNAIAAFLANELPLPKESGPLAGKRYEQLPTDLSDDIDDFRLDFTVIRNAADGEVREMFLRLQAGVKLNAAEELNAIAGGMRNFVVSLVALPLFDRKVSFSNQRGAHRHVAAQLTKLAVAGFGDVRKADLIAFYKTNQDWSPDEKAQRLRQVLQWSSALFDDKDPALRNRGQVVSLIWGLYSLWDDLVFKGHEDEVRSAFRKVDEKHVGDDPAWKDYQFALSHSSDQKKSLETRQQYVSAAIAEWAPGIQRRDPKRAFSAAERAAIYYRDHEICQRAGCGKHVPFTEFHADHVTAWTKGGPTTLENAQVLCARHNLSKGAGD